MKSALEFPVLTPSTNRKKESNRYFTAVNTYYNIYSSMLRKGQRYDDIYAEKSLLLRLCGCV